MATMVAQCDRNVRSESSGYLAAVPAEPVTRYAPSGGVHLAYQVAGAGPPDILLVNTWISHVEEGWTVPEMARFRRRMAGLGRLIVFDRRGVGLSDAVDVAALPSLETQVEDIVAVLDAVGSESATLVGTTEGGPLAMLLAARHPERCQSLVVVAAAARVAQDESYPWGLPEDTIEKLLQMTVDDLLSGDAEHFRVLVPSLASDEHAIERLVRHGRQAVRPGAVAHYFGQAFRTDIRDVLPRIDVPTLILQISGDPVAPPPFGQYMAEHIPGAVYRELPGTDHIFWSQNGDAVADEIEEFVTGGRRGGEPDRVLATLLFTDIVGSTARAAALGDRRWRELLDEHDAAVRRQLDRFGGREIDTAGDGFFAAFDGPGHAIRCARAISEALTPLDLQIRAGVHTGEVEVRGNGMGGLAVHIAARVAALAGGDEVLVSGTVKDLLAGSGLQFDDRGEHELKGVPGTWRVFAVGSSPG
jgi:pimeloyl-ACP methyl ester carboxylesterase